MKRNSFIAVLAYLFNLNSSWAGQVCKQELVIKSLPAKDLPKTGQKADAALHSYQLFKVTGQKIRVLDSYYGEKQGSFKLSKFYPEICLSVFEASDNWEHSHTVVFDHLSGEAHRYDKGGALLVSNDGTKYSVWDCYVATDQSEYGACGKDASFKVFATVAGGSRILAGNFKLSEIINKINVERKIQELEGVTRIYLNPMKDEFVFELIAKTNETVDEMCEGECPHVVESLGKVRIRFLSSRAQVEVAR